MINIYEYLLSKNNAEIAEEPDEIKNWESMKELLNDFCNDSDEKDSGDEAIESLIRPTRLFSLDNLQFSPLFNHLN